MHFITGYVQILGAMLSFEINIIQAFLRDVQ